MRAMSRTPSPPGRDAPKLVTDDVAGVPSGGGVRPLGSVLKTLELLDFLGEAAAPLRLADIARQLGGNRATHYQRLLTLVQAGWVELDERGQYRIALHATRVGEAALRHASLDDRAQSVLQALAHETGETASLAMIDGTAVRIARRAEPDGVLKAKLHVGDLLTLDGSASGRVLAAFMPEPRVASLQQRGALLPGAAALRQTRKAGHALSAGRDMPEVMAIAMPVFDALGDCYGALSLVAPVSRFSADALRAPLERAAHTLSHRRS